VNALTDMVKDREMFVVYFSAILVPKRKVASNVLNGLKRNKLARVQELFTTRPML
jgi:hypothetical protein